jgi:nucleoid DNA-binding protein
MRRRGEGVNKTELIEEIAQRTHSSKAEAQRYTDTLEKVLTEALKGGEEGQITGFGKFYVREQKAREGFNPQTRERMRIPAQKVPAFSAGQGLKQAI